MWFRVSRTTYKDPPYIGTTEISPGGLLTTVLQELFALDSDLWIYVDQFNSECWDRN